MELRPDTRRCLDEFAEVRARLADFHAYAEREIQAALRGCLLLDAGLCTQAARCLDSVRAASGHLTDSPPVLLLSGPGAFATLATCLLDDGGGCGDDPATEAAAADAGFSRLRGLLQLQHQPELTGRTVRLRRVSDGSATAAAASVDADVREFVDWAVAGRWLAESGPAELRAADEAVGGGAGADWELGLRCPDLAGLRVLVAPRLSRWTRGKLRQHLPNCALLLHHVDFAEAAEPERELREAVEHCVLLLTDQKDILMLHNRLHFVCRLPDAPDGADAVRSRQAAVDMVDAALRDFMPDAAERRRRVLFHGGSALSIELQELLQRQMTESGHATLRQLLSGLCGLSRAVRGVRGCHLANEASSSEQHRSQQHFTGDLERLHASARAAARSFQRQLDVQLSDLSVQIESHLRRQEVKDRLASAFVEFCTSHPQLKRQEHEQYLLEQVGLELHNWNRETQIFLKLDRGICKLKADHFQQLCRMAERIPELVALRSDAFCDPPPSESFAGDDSLSSRTVLSVGIRQIGGQQMRRSFLQSLAVGIGMPLFVPLAAITMAIIWPVTFFRRGSGADSAATSFPRPGNSAMRPEQPVRKKSAKKLHDQAWDFCDKIGRQFINDNFFVVTRHFLQEDARMLEQYVEQFCIVPQDPRMRSELLDNPQRLQGQLDDFQKRLQGLMAQAKLFGATRLGFGMLLPDQCRPLGIDSGASSESLLGERIGGGAFSTVFALPGATPGRPQLALKLINASSTCSALLEAEMMRELASDPHPNLLLCLGSVHFPALQQLGLIMPRCHCNLRQLLQRHRQLLVPVAVSPEQRERILTACMRLCQQVLSGVRHLHGKRILHRDLKLENVLADLPDGGDPSEAQLRICDFGFAKEEEMMSGTSFVGTFGYVAPELAPPAPKFSVKSDVFALGVMLWECYYGVSAPKIGTSQIGIMLNGDCGIDFLIRLMTHTMPQERPHIEQCIAMLTLRQRSSEWSSSLRVVSFEDSLRIASQDEAPATG